MIAYVKYKRTIDPLHNKQTNKLAIIAAGLILFELLRAVNPYITVTYNVCLTSLRSARALYASGGGRHDETVVYVIIHTG